MPSLLPLLLLSLLSPAIAELCNQHDKEALLNIGSQIVHKNHSWFSARNTACCEWDEVFCNENGRVLKLYISGQEHRFTIPPAVVDLPYLTSLILTGNPGLVGPIPPFIGEMKGLTNLGLSLNKLTGRIPDLSGLSILTNLDLSYNRLSGSIPPSLGKLPALQVILLGRNQLTGEIPSSLGTLSAGVLLDLGQNKLVGTIPKSFSNNNYELIDLSRNNLMGDALVLFGALKPLKVLDLSRNTFEFNMSMVRFPENMTQLDLNHNKLYGSFPPKLGAQWDRLNVSYNRLCGPLPTGDFAQIWDYLNEYSFLHNKCLCGAPLPPCK